MLRLSILWNDFFNHTKHIMCYWMGRPPLGTTCTWNFGTNWISWSWMVENLDDIQHSILHETLSCATISYKWVVTTKKPMMVVNFHVEPFTNFWSSGNLRQLVTCSTYFANKVLCSTFACFFMVVMPFFLWYMQSNLYGIWCARWKF